MMNAKMLGQLLDRHETALALYARQWCHIAEDVVQEAFVQLLKQKTVPNDPAAWLFRVVRNQAISAARSNRRRSERESRFARERPIWFEDGSTSDLDADEVARVLEGLPLEMREIIVAHLWGGLTFEQIVEISGGSSSTAHRRYAEGLSLLRERLNSECLNEKKLPS